ncbi:MAG: hypothetical protein LUH10_12280 [Tannerellaceae bacterium]|nr:hypothetical protein [Tannerellaceae bacterium]
MKYILLTFLIFFLFCSCDNKYEKTILRKAEILLDEYPDSALYILDQLKDISSLSDEDKAAYGFVKAFIHAKTGKSLIDDNLVVFALDYYREIGSSDKLLKLYELVYLHHFENMNYSSGLEALDEAINFAISRNDSSSVARFYERKAQALFPIGERRDVELNLRKSLSFQENENPYYLLGLWFTGRDSIGYYMDKSIEIALSKGDNINAAHYLRNYAQCLYGWEEYEEAINKLKLAISISDYRFTPFLVTSQCYLQLGNLDSAQYYLNQAKQFRLLFDSQQSVPTRENAIAQVQSVIDYNKYGSFHDTEIARYNDSIYFEMARQQKLLEARMESKYALERENMYLFIKRQQYQFGGVLGLIVVFLSGGMVFLYFRKKRQKWLEAEETIETLNHLLKEVTENSINENDSRFFKKILLQQLGLIRLVATIPTAKNQELLRQMSQIISKDVPSDSLLVWEDLYPIIDSIYENFYSELIANYGTILIEKEIQLCCLLCADFSTKEIQAVTQQSIPTIYQRKTTIRKKLQIEEKEDIILFLKSQKR